MCRSSGWNIRLEINVRNYRLKSVFIVTDKWKGSHRCACVYSKYSMNIHDEKRSNDEKLANWNSTEHMPMPASEEIRAHFVVTILKVMRVLRWECVLSMEQ